MNEESVLSALTKQKIMLRKKYFSVKEIYKLIDVPT